MTSNNTDGVSMALQKLESLEQRRLNHDIELLRLQKRDLTFRRLRFFIPLLLMLAYLAKVSLVDADAGMPDEPYVSVVNIRGEIGEGKSASPEVINPLLDKAFADDEALGVVVSISSPGGAPVASDEIRTHIVSLRKEYPDKPVIVYGSEMLTSGAYLIASGSDQIYANPNSTVGSIGVIIRGFGFYELASKLGIERRILAAGEHKSRMDPFQPLNESDKRKMLKMINKIHLTFIDTVKQARGDRITKTFPELFSGDYWTGAEALSYGLLDGVGTFDDVLTEVFGTSETKSYRTKKSLLKILTEPVMSVLKLGVDEQSNSPFRLLPW